jgi:hypothetical protein
MGQDAPSERSGPTRAIPELSPLLQLIFRPFAGAFLWRASKQIVNSQLFLEGS